jgi:hypothetical protein
LHSRPRTTHYLALVWGVACLSVLAFASTRFQFSDLDMVFFPLMVVLTFPIGLLAALIGLLVYFPFAYFLALPAGGAFFYFVVWLAMVGAGYWQWFIVLPHALQKRHA